MPPPHLAVLNPQNSEDDAPARGRLARLRASVATSFEKPGEKPATAPAIAKSRMLRVPPLLGRAPRTIGAAPAPQISDQGEDRGDHQGGGLQGSDQRGNQAMGAAAGGGAEVAATSPGPAADNARELRPALAMDEPPAMAAAAFPPPLARTAEPPASPAAGPRQSFLARPARLLNDGRGESLQAGPRGQPQAAPPLPEPVPLAKPRPPRAPQEDLIADLPPAQAPLRISVAPLAFSTPVPRPVVPVEGGRPPAAERAFRTGRQGARPAHAMSAVEIAAWREGAMEAGRTRDPIFGRPRLWWWLALSLILLPPMAYAAGWLGMAGSGAEFLSTPMGQEAWIIMGGPDAAWVYWGMLFVVALTVQFLRPLEPVLILCAATWWGWTALHAAWVAGWLAQRIPPLPMPG